MKNLEAVIFDLDGVIVFTDKFHFQAWKKIADKLEIYFDEEINNRLRGVSRMDSLEIILEEYEGEPLSRERKEELAEEKNEAYRELLKTMTPADVEDDVRETLAEIRRRGYGIALGSSSKNARFILERVGLMDAFDKISDGTNITKSKPDPEVFQKAARFLGKEPQKCLVVEDADAGITAGIAGGMQTAAIGDAVRSGKATYTLNKFRDLLEILV
ncbi:MAG: beta-phosphoglucomutase [Eubacteriales bacterium]|nr:beta-phosphoglucomutase [Eubacteriales bacterium]